MEGDYEVGEPFELHPPEQTAEVSESVERATSADEHSESVKFGDLHPHSGDWYEQLHTLSRDSSAARSRSRGRAREGSRIRSRNSRGMC